MSADWLAVLTGHPQRRAPSKSLPAEATRLEALLGEYAALEQKSPATLAAWQAQLLDALARHAALTCPLFAQRLRTCGLASQILAETGVLQQLPPLHRHALQEGGAAWGCRSVPASHGSVHTTSTSGSTGEPVTVRRTELSGLHWQALTVREHLWHARDFTGRLAVTRANVTRHVQSPDWGPPMTTLFRTGPSEALPATRPLSEIAEWLQKFRPDYWLALPSVIHGLIEHFRFTGATPVKLRGVRTLSETVAPDLRAAVLEQLKASLHDIYSSQEAGIIATQCPEFRSYHVSEGILLEVIDDQGRPCRPGEVGRILLTDLLNFATPLIRYEIGDYAEAGDFCACGRGTRTLRRILGRERNLLRLPDGSRHWPTVGFHQWGAILPVRQFQFIQTARDCLTARLVVPGRPTAAQEAALTEVIQRALGYPFRVKFEWSAIPLPRGPRGKFEEFVCQAD